MVNEPSVFELLRFDCKWIYTGNVSITKHSLPKAAKKIQCWTHTHTHTHKTNTERERERERETYPQNSQPSLQRQHFFTKPLPLRWICCCTEYLMSRLIIKRVLVLFIFHHRTYFWIFVRIASLRRFSQISKNLCFFKVLNTTFLQNVWLIVTS